MLPDRERWILKNSLNVCITLRCRSGLCTRQCANIILFELVTCAGFTETGAGGSRGSQIERVRLAPALHTRQRAPVVETRGVDT